MSLTERKIQAALYWHLRDQGYAMACPNYTPRKWWECDMLGVTKANRFVEFEIKLSRSDFLADARKKDDDSYGWEHDPATGKGRSVLRKKGEFKHAKLQAGDEHGPSRFFFVVPTDLIPVSDVPSWAGLLYATPCNRGLRDSAGNLRDCFLRQVKAAPHLHKKPASTQSVCHLTSVFYWRYWSLRLGHNEENAPV